MEDETALYKEETVAHEVVPDDEGLFYGECPAPVIKSPSLKPQFAEQTLEDYLKTLPPVNLKGCSDTNLAKDVVIYVFGEELRKQFHDAAKNRCNGCQNDYPNLYDHHTCVWLDDDDSVVDGIFRESLNRVDISYLKDLYLETASILQVNLPLSIFYHQIECQKDLWEQLRYFGVVVTAIKNMNFGQITNLIRLMEAVHSAQSKVDKLEKHFARSSLKE